jgi:hypothetical protein
MKTNTNIEVQKELYWDSSESLPELPDSLVEVLCSPTTELPILPDSLVEVLCSPTTELPS